MEFRFMQEPYMSEINNYIRQRREHITFYTTTQVGVLGKVGVSIT
jgi:hypothetical protein